jgi:rhamnose transport system permease protein
MNKMKGFVNRNVKELVTLGIIIVVLIASVIAEPNLLNGKRFGETMNSILLWMPINLTIAMGMMMAVIVREIDLSVGSGLALCAMIVGILWRDQHWPLWAGLILSCVIGIALGAFNGVLLGYINIPSIIVTLGTINVYRGLVYIISRGSMVTNYNLPDALQNLSNHGPWIGSCQIPWLVIISFLIAIIFFFILKYTPFGRQVYAVGSNREAAHLRGINYKFVLFMIFTITGLLFGIAGMMSASRYGYVNPNNTGNGQEFVVITATIIGGVSVAGGRGSVIGVFLGCFLLGEVNTMLAMLGIPGTVQTFVYGLIIVVALLIDHYVAVFQTRARLNQIYHAK